MGLRKGQTNNPNGRIKGSKTKKTKQWEVLGESIIDIHANRFNTVLAKLDDVDFVNAYTKILSYFKPQLARTELKDTTTDKTPPVQIIVSNDNDKKELDKFLDEDN